MKELKTAGVRLPDSPLVPYPSRSLVPERDVRYAPVLEASRLGIDFGGLTAVDDFTLTIGRTEIAGLIGPNGAGKTTVFNLLTSVYQPTRGSILINGMPTAGKSTHQVSRMGIARTFQNIRLFRNLTVRMIFLVLSYALMFWAIYRALSRNTYKRYQENRKFLLIFDRLKDRNNRYFNCPKCHQTVRVPRGKGKISITCPKCREKFIRKT